MLKKIINIIFPFFFLLSICRTGHIYSQPSLIIPQNAGIASCFHLFFLLETPLPSNNYLYLQWPFDIGALSQALLSTSLDPNIKATIQTISSNIEGNHGFFQIKQDIAADIWYRLEFRPSNLQNQVPEQPSCVFFATTSYNVKESMIIYDRNPCFDLFSFAKPLNDPTSLKVYASFSLRAQEAHSFNQIHQVFFDIFVKISLPEPLRLRFTIEKDFFFADYCSSLPCIISDSTTSDCPKDFNVSQISPYACEGASNTMVFSMVTPLLETQRLRVSALIINPNKVANSRMTATLLGNQAEYWFVNTSILESQGNEFYLWTNYTQNIEIDIESKLFWGLAPTRLRNKNGFIGCPISLYQNNNRTVYNSFITNFKLSSRIVSFKDNGFLAVVWKLIEIKKVISNFLMNSVQTNLPFVKGNAYTSCNFDTDNSLIKCSYIDDLIENKLYSISAKFSIGNNYNFTRLYSCGIIEIQTFNNNKTEIMKISVSRGTLMNIRKTQDYFDVDLVPQINYNQLFSYIYSDTINYNFDGQHLIKTLQNQFFGGGDANSKPKTAVYPQKTEKTDQIFALFLFFNAKNMQICSDNYAEMTISSCTTPLSQSDSYAVLLKIVFNNNILGIPSEDFPKGVDIIGTLFKTYDSLLNLNNYGMVQNYNQFNNNDKLANFIDVLHQSNNMGTFWHVSIVCKYELLFNINRANPCYEILEFHANTPISASGLGFINTNIKKFPSLYADDLILDFIICFKLTTFDNYVRGNENQNENKWFLLENANAGPGIINGYAITNSLNSSKITFSNVFLDANNHFPVEGNSLFENFFASYLRISFQMTSFDGENASKIGIFLESDQLDSLYDLFYGLASYKDENNMVNAADYQNNVETKSFVLQASTNKISNLMMMDFWWAHHSIILDYKKGNTLDFDVFFPLQITFSQIISLNVVIFKNMSQIINVYRVYGGHFETIQKKILILKKFPTGVENPIPPLLSTWDHSTATDIGCIYNGSIKPGLNNEMKLFPNQIFSRKTKNPLYFNSDVSFNNVERCNISSGNNENNGWGSIFAIYSFEDIFIPEAIWYLKTPNSYQQKSKCIMHKFSKCLNSICFNNFLKNFSTILCPVDFKEDIGNYSHENGQIILDFFRVPLYWGQNYSLSKNLFYIWSNPQGLAVLIQPEFNNITYLIENYSLVSDIYGVPAFTLDASFLFNLETSLTYVLKKGMSIKFKHIIIPTGSYLYFTTNICLHSILQCDILVQNEYLLTNNDNEEFIIKAFNKLWIQVFMNTQENTATKHFLIINYMGYDTEKTNKADFLIDVPQLKKSIIINDFQFYNGQTSFNFLVENLITPNYQLNFMINYTFNQILKCSIFEKNGTISNDWLILKQSGNGLIVLQSRIIIFKEKLYKFKCLGTYFSNIKTNSLLILALEGALQDSQNQIILNTNRIISFANFSPIDNNQLIFFNKTYSATGFESEYNFEFSPKVRNISLSGRILLFCSSFLAPKLNDLGNIECFIDEILAICNFIDENMIEIYPTNSLLVNEKYQIKMLGIKQPDTQLNNFEFANNIFYFAIDDDADISNGVVEDYFLEDSFLNNPNEINALYISDFKYVGDLIRNKTKIKISLKISSNTLNDQNNYLILKLPAFFGISTFFSSNELICSFTSKNNNLTINLSKKYVIENGRSVKLFLEKDTFNYNTDPYYDLVISNLTTPQEISPLYRIGFHIFLRKNDGIIYTTTSSNRNSEIYMSFKDNPYKSKLIFKKFLNSEDGDDFYVNIGYFLNPIFLFNNLLKNFNDSFSVSIIFQEGLAISPSSTLEIETGLNSFVFYMALSNLNYWQGIYFIRPSFKNPNNSLYSLPFYLPIKVIYKKCVISVNSEEIDISFNSISNPIILDFSRCILINEITISASITNEIWPFLMNLTFENNLNYIEKNLQCDLNNKLIFLYLYSQSKINIIDQQNLYHASLVRISIIGESSAYLDDIKPVYINYLAENNTMPQVLQPSIENSTIKLGCDQNGQIFFVCRINQDNENISIDFISNKTKNLEKNLAHVGENDSTWSIFGFYSNLKPNIYIDISLKGLLKSMGNYSMFSYCSNLNNINSTQPNNFSWVQPNNGGKNTIIKLVFNISLNKAQKELITCYLSQIFALESERLWNEDRTYCNINNEIKLKNSSVIIQKNIEFSYNYVVLPNYISEKDETFDLIEKIATKYSKNLTKALAELDQTKTNILPISLNFFFEFEDPEFYLREIQAYEVFYDANLTELHTYSLNLSFYMKGKGYIYAGISNSSAKIPSFQQLMWTTDGEGNHLEQFNQAEYYEDHNVWLNFSYLNPNQTYIIFYCGSNFDPSWNIIASKIKKIEIKTNELVEILQKDQYEQLLFVNKICLILFLSLFFTYN